VPTNPQFFSANHPGAVNSGKELLLILSDRYF